MVNKHLLHLIITYLIIFCCAGCGVNSSSSFPGRSVADMEDEPEAPAEGTGFLGSLSEDRDSDQEEDAGDSLFSGGLAERAVPGESNGETVFIEDVVEPWCGSDVRISAGGNGVDGAGYILYDLSFDYHGYEVCVYTMAENNGEYAGSISIRGTNSGKSIANVPVTIFDDNTLTEINKKWNTSETAGFMTYVKSVENLKEIMQAISSSDGNYDDEDQCPLEGTSINHTHPEPKKQETSGMSPGDFDPDSNYFNLEEYFKSFGLPGSYSYSSFDAGYESFGGKEGQIYNCYYTTRGYEISIRYTDQEDFWSYESGQIRINDAESGDIIAIFERSDSRDKVVIDEQGNTCYRDTLKKLVQIMPVIVAKKYEGYCPFDGLGIEHHH